MEITLKIKLDQSLSSDELAQLARVADASGRSVEDVVSDAIRRVVLAAREEVEA